MALTMMQEQTRRERVLVFVNSLVGLPPGWRPVRHHYVWAIIIAVAASLMVMGGIWLWERLYAFIDPEKASQRQDLVNLFIIIAGGVVGLLTALVALGNFYTSRSNLQQQQALANERAQVDALQNYFEQMGSLLTDKEQPLRRAQQGDNLSVVARAWTINVLQRLGRHKSSVLQFLYDSHLIAKERIIIRKSGLIERQQPVVSLAQADLSGADLGGARLVAADLSRTELHNADLSDAWLWGADLSKADLSNADLSGADLGRANLERANLSDAKGIPHEQLSAAKSFEGATMPNGQKYEDWLKDKKAQGKDEKNK
jgi:pentapeptide repeat protein